MFEIKFRGGLLGLSEVHTALWWSIAALVVIGAYFLGSINFAIYISKAAYHKDIREYGSKNAGMTNMMRTFGTKAAAVVLIGDILKSIVSVSLGMLLCGIDVAYVAGIFCILGHCYPVYYKFKGGKGFATAAGMVLAAEPLVFFFCLIIFVLVVWATKFISAGSILAALFFPLVLSMVHRVPFGISLTMALCSVFLAFFILFNHRANIARILSGTEKKFSFKKSVPTDAEKEAKKNSDEPSNGKKDD
jgi:glycerol-3-phosphate acyltransferase PlsY